MGKHHPRRGTLQFWPRVRSSRQYPKIRSWPDIKDNKLLGFIGYKAGMTHIIFTDTKGTSHTKGLQVSFPVTVLECPPIKPLSIRFYKSTSTGLRLLSEIFSSKLNKELKRIMIEAFEEVYRIAKERNIALRTAAYIISVSRIAKAIELRGIFP